MRYFILAAATLPLIGCINLKANELIAPNTYRLTVLDQSVDQSPIGATMKLDQASLERCNSGYEKISEKISLDKGDHVYTWTIRCQIPTNK